MLQEPWRITLLGGLHAAQPSQTISRFRTQKTGALLARLALFPRRAHPREELADLLWPDDTPEAARAKLRIALSSLRRQLEPPGAGGVLVADRHTVRLQDAAFTTDVADFEAALASASHAADAAERQARLTQALALYDGDLLPGFYDDWIVDERHRLAARLETAQRECESAPPAPNSGGAVKEGFTPGCSSPAPPELGAGGPSSACRRPGHASSGASANWNRSPAISTWQMATRGWSR